MCALEAAQRGLRVLVVDHSPKPGRKILISGGGRCNFTNLHSSMDNYLSHNPKFCLSALHAFTPWDFIALLEQHHIAFSEKKEGQLFCDNSARQVVQLLVDQCERSGVKWQLACQVNGVKRQGEGFLVATNQGTYLSGALVVATGGRSFPKLGATGLGYTLAKQFGHAVHPPQPALVPFTLEEKSYPQLNALAGISLDVIVSLDEEISFQEALLFTHRGLSGPAILQISSYWQSGRSIQINLLPHLSFFDHLIAQKSHNPKQSVPSLLNTLLPRRLAQWIGQQGEHPHKRIGELSKQQIQQWADRVNRWQITPGGTEGYRTAEVTKGGVDTAELSSKTMESRRVAGLYFIGEVLDVTGQLGGFNLQWAWSSGWAAGKALRSVVANPPQPSYS
ncbi:MAG: NAD(P)/FAD-dependent oxidoreductase [Magnetococcales bacterium]|nr:NAD(P)/FAD-dependent oxidoreductase [Magnetococcales bacterium]